MDERGATDQSELSLMILLLLFLWTELTHFQYEPSLYIPRPSAAT